MVLRFRDPGSGLRLFHYGELEIHYLSEEPISIHNGSIVEGLTPSTVTATQFWGKP